MVDNNSPPNTLYVVDSTGKLNVVDVPNQQQYLLNGNADHKMTEPPDNQYLNALGSDLPQLKKTFNTPYGGLNYHPESLSVSTSNLCINESYFNLFANGANTGSRSSESAVSQQAQLSSQIVAFHPTSSSQNGLPLPPPLPLPTNNEQQPSANGMAQARSSTSSSTTDQHGLVVVHHRSGRGRKRSKKGPFICSECQKEFSNQSTLTKHMITHSDERKFSCLQCGKAFKRHDHLNGHMLTHREHKPYACDLEGCDKSYCDARSLRRHKEKHKENEGLLLSQNHPGLAVTDKVNASYHLKCLAMQQQQQKLHVGNINHHSEMNNFAFTKLINNQDKTNLLNVPESSSTHQLALKSNNEDELNRSIFEPNLPPPPPPPPPQQSSLSSENALLHQLLTSHDNRTGNLKQPSTTQQQQHDQSVNQTSVTPHHNLVHRHNTNHHNNHVNTNHNQHNTNPSANTNLSQQLSHNSTTVIKLVTDGHYLNGNSNHTGGNHMLMLSNIKNVSDNNNNKDTIADEHNNIYAGLPKLVPNFEKIAQLTTTTTTVNNNIESNVNCGFCTKRFNSIASLNEHIRVHANCNFNINYLLGSKTSDHLVVDTTTGTKIVSQTNANHHHENLSKGGDSISYSLEYSQQQSKMPFDGMPKEFGFDNVPSKESGEYGEMHLFTKDNDINFQNIGLRSTTTSTLVVSDQFKAPLNYNTDKTMNQSINTNMIDSNDVFQNNIYPEKNENMLGLQSSPHCATNQTNKMNDIMFSPITPVTPLKSNQQFTFDFTPQPTNGSKKQSTVDNTQDTGELDCKTDQINYSVNIEGDLVGDSFCFDEHKTDSLSKNDIPPLQPIDIGVEEDNFNDLTSDSINAGQEVNLSKSVDSIVDSAAVATTNEANFDRFDLPSGKLTSDLYHRRLRKHMDDSKRTRELLDIKRIAASLQSFSQSYERSQHAHNSNGGQPSQLSHSYSVPNTPLIMGSNGQYGNGGQEHYQPNSMSHHSLPTTPIDSTSHFTFNNCHNQTSLPSTPLENGNQTQFTFTNSEDQQSSDILNDTNFDMACLDQPQYPSEFISTQIYHSKELNSHFIENDNNYIKSNNLLDYADPLAATTGDASLAAAVSTDSNVNYTNFNNENIFPSRESFDFDQALMETTGIDTKKANEQVSLFVVGSEETRVELAGVNSQTSTTTNTPMTCAERERQFNCNNSDSQHGATTVTTTTTTIEKDINSNYIIPSACDTFDKTTNNNKLKSASNNNNNSKHVAKANTLKALLNLKHQSSISACSISSVIKKKHKPEPLYIPPDVNTFMFQSRLRSPRIRLSSINGEVTVSGQHLPPPYTPPPMLSPVRCGPGLFWKLTGNTLINSKYSNTSLLLKKTNESREKELENPPPTAYEPLIYEYDIPQTDIQPHVNIGPNYQARIPAFNSDRKGLLLKPDKADILWHPETLAEVQEDKLELYLKLARSACLPGQGNNCEYALHTLHQNKGDVLDALAQLVNPKPTVESSHPLADYHYADHNCWTSEEISLFQKSILKHDKDFVFISHEVKSKTTKECIEFYYLWKKSFPEISKRLRFLRRKRESVFYNMSSKNGGGITNEAASKLTENLDSYNTALESDLCASTTTTNKTTKGGNSNYPCPKCGKTFKKLRSRSAHMKIHGNL